MILDIHTHNLLGQAEAVARAAASHGIDRFIFLGDVLRFGALPTPEQIRQLNDETCADVQRHFDHCRGFCYLNPANPPAFLAEEAERCLRRPEFLGIKLEISVNCRSPLLDPFLEVLEKHDAVLLHHCWYKTVDKYPGESNPSDVAVLARRHPKAKIVMAHLGGDGIRGIEDIADCPNVTVDTSGAQPEAGFLEYAVRRLGAHRLVYGSDAPCRSFGCQLARVQEARLTDAIRERIFSLNARELLKW